MLKRFRFSGSVGMALVFLFLVVLVAGAMNAEAAIHYVRAGAAGAANGNDWTNAYAALPAALVRGDTYYIAGGSYGSYSFDDAASGSTVITVRKATAADHGTDTGWSDAYGASQAVFSYWGFSTSYWTIDGNLAGGYGFSIVSTTSTLGAVQFSGTASFITVKSLSVDNTGSPDVSRNFYINCSNCSNLLISNVETRKSGNDCYLMLGVNDSIFEYLYLNSKVATTYHGDGIETYKCNNITLRYSRFNWNDQMIFFSGVAASGTFYIYGNLFYDQPSVGKPIHSQSGDPVVGPIYVYNNTFVNTLYSIYVYSNTTGVMNNNLYYNAPVSGYGSLSHDYNASNANLGETNGQIITSAIFSDYAKGVYTLSGHTKPGLTLGPPYVVDAFGTSRNADGNWDRGAYQYGTAAGKLPGAPGNLTVY